MLHYFDIQTVQNRADDRQGRGSPLRPRHMVRARTRLRLGVPLGLAEQRRADPVAEPVSRLSARHLLLWSVTSFLSRFLDSTSASLLLLVFVFATGEAEVLFAPLTGMELQKESAIFTNGKKLRHIYFRPTCNQRAVQIQELVGRRQNRESS